MTTIRRRIRSKRLRIKEHLGEIYSRLDDVNQQLHVFEKAIIKQQVAGQMLIAQNRDLNERNSFLTRALGLQRGIEVANKGLMDDERELNLARFHEAMERGKSQAPDIAQLIMRN